MDATRPRHIPVLVEEVLAFLRPELSGTVVDGTVGLGGHASALLERGTADLRLIGFDRDAESLEIARERLDRWGGRVTLVCSDFREAPAYLKKAASPAGFGAGSSISGSARSTSTRRSAGSRSSKTRPSTCAWTAASGRQRRSS